MSTDDKANYVMYKDRKEWSDLVPIKQNDGPHPVVKILYSVEFEDVFDYFRGVVAARELSQRALNLTEDCIEFNAANYSVWQYRRLILKHINGDLQNELSFCREMIEENPKNYQVWHHRRVIVEWLNDPSKELRLTEMIFAQDPKNYHAWEHRQWTLRSYEIYDMELGFTERLLNDDVRNNSAWNHRYFVLSRTSGLTLDVLKKEMDFVKKAIEKLQDNESVWTYIKGLLQYTDAEEAELSNCWHKFEVWCIELFKKTLSEKNGVVDLKDLTRICRGDISPHLLIGILDCICNRMDSTDLAKSKEEDLQHAVLICEALSSTHDVIRTRYWQYFKRSQLAKHSSATSSNNQSNSDAV